MDKGSSGLRFDRVIAAPLVCIAVLASPQVLAAKNNDKGNAWGIGRGNNSSNCDSTAAPPTIAGTPTLSLLEGDAYSFVPDASDPNCDSLSFSIIGKPPWASFNSRNGSLSGTPPAGSAGTYYGITISVTDGTYTTSLASFAITVESDQGPTISGQPAPNVLVGQTYAFTPSAHDADGDPLSFKVANMPPWASFDSSSGRLSGTPASANAGEYVDISISVSDGKSTASLAPFSIVVDVPNSAPTISGTPSTEVTAGQEYNFVPKAFDADYDPLTFRVVNKPAWATFDTATGQLSGTPGAGDSGTYSNIQISVSDGQLTAALSAFSVTVQQVSTGSAMLSWQPPTQRTDGSPLSDLAGYRILYGKNQGNYDNEVTLDNAGLTSYVVSNLAQGTWYFVMTAFDSTGAESDYSTVGTKTVQ